MMFGLAVPAAASRQVGTLRAEVHLLSEPRHRLVFYAGHVLITLNVLAEGEL